jgi:hypothetical protein
MLKMNESADNLTLTPKDPRVLDQNPGPADPRPRRRPNLDLNLIRAYGLEVLDWMATDEDLDDLSLVVPSQTPDEGRSASPAQPEFTTVTLELPQLLNLIHGLEPAGFPIAVANHPTA